MPAVLQLGLVSNRIAAGSRSVKYSVLVCRTRRDYLICCCEHPLTVTLTSVIAQDSTSTTSLLLLLQVHTSTPAAQMAARLSNPRLLATTNERREGPPQPFTEREVVLCLRASHPIVPVWESTLLPAMLHVVNDMKIPMSHIDVVRLYRPSGSLDPSDQAAEAEQAPVVVYVGVRDAVSRDLAEAFVARCDNVIQSHGIHGVFVEMHHSTVALFSPPFLPNNPLSDTREFDLPFQLSIGMDITPITAKNKQGTSGIFVSLQDRPGAFALTCAHVLTDNHTVERTPLDPTPGVEVTFLGALSYQNRLRDIEDAQWGMDWKRQEALDSMSIATSLDQRAELLAKSVAISAEQAIVADLTEVLSDDDWATDANRVIGRAFCFSPQGDDIERDWKTTPGVGMEDGLGFTEDWGLVQLDQDCVTPGVELNYVPVTSALSPTADGKPRHLRRFFDPIPQVFAHWTLRVSGIAPLSDFHNREVTVFKRGAKTGQTVGTVNPVKSVTRTLVKGDKTEYTVDTLAVTVVGLPETPFSMEGDSGSAVIDEQGRVLAMVWGGPPDRSDLTYATPIEFIFDRMRQLYGLEPSLILVPPPSSPATEL